MKNSPFENQLCEICGKESANLERHKVFIYFDFLKNFSKFHTIFQLHVMTHTDKKRYSCDLCDKSFVSATKLNQHKQRQHWEEVKHMFPADYKPKKNSSKPICDLCGKKLQTKTELKVFNFNNFHLLIIYNQFCWFYLLIYSCTSIGFT